MMSWLPENISTYGKEIDDLFYLIYYITGAAFLLVTVLLVAFLWLYRSRPGHKAVYSHGNTTLEMVWTIVPAVILVVLTLLAIPSWSKIKSHVPSHRPSDPHHRRSSSTGRWPIPGPDGKFDTEDDQTLDNEVHVPVGQGGRPPAAGPGRHPQRVHPPGPLQAGRGAGPGDRPVDPVTKPGKYEIPCAELCGFGHSGHEGFLFVHTAEEYQQWLKEKWPG